MSSNLGTLFVSVIRGRGLYNVEVLGRKMDPYTKIQFQGTMKRTSVSENGHKTPEWSDPPFEFTVTESNSGKSVLVLEVFEENRMMDDAMIGCNYQFDISEYLNTSSSEERPAFISWVPLQTIGGKAGGEIMIKLWFRPTTSTHCSSKNMGINLADLTPSSSNTPPAGTKPLVWAPPNLNQPNATTTPSSISHAPVPISNAPITHQHSPIIPIRQSSSASNLSSVPSSNTAQKFPGSYPEAPPPMSNNHYAPLSHGPRPLPSRTPTGPHVNDVYSHPQPQPQPQQSHHHHYLGPTYHLGGSSSVSAPSRPVYPPPPPQSQLPYPNNNQSSPHQSPGVYMQSTGGTHVSTTYTDSSNQLPRPGSAPNLVYTGNNNTLRPGSHPLPPPPPPQHQYAYSHHHQQQQQSQSQPYPTNLPYPNQLPYPSTNTATTTTKSVYPPSTSSNNNRMNISQTPAYPSHHHSLSNSRTNSQSELHPSKPVNNEVYPPPNHLYPPPPPQQQPQHQRYHQQQQVYPPPSSIPNNGRPVANHNIPSSSNTRPYYR